jgi:hypothetical protein
MGYLEKENAGLHGEAIDKFFSGLVKFSGRNYKEN